MSDNPTPEQPEQPELREPPESPEPPEQRGRGRTFSFSFNLGRKPPGDDPEVQRMIEEARRKAEASPDGVGTASREQELFSMEYADGRLRIGDRDATPPYERAPDEALPRLPEQPADDRYADGFPDTDAIRRVMGRIKLAVVIALPIAAVVAGVASGYSRETVIWMGIFGLMLSAMVAAMLPG